MKQVVEFKELPKGAKFEFNGQLYMKIGAEGARYFERQDDNYVIVFASRIRCIANVLKTVVRIEQGKPLIFTDAPTNAGMVECFSFAGGHCEASREYMRRLPLADDATAKREIIRYQRYVNSLPDCGDIIITQARRIRR